MPQNFSHRRLSLFVLVGVLSLSAAGVGSAQVALPPMGAGVAVETYRFRDAEAAGVRSITLLSTPFQAAIPLTAGTRLELSGGYGRGVLVRRDGSESRVQGPTDTQLRLRVPVGGTSLVLSAIAVLPTGISTFSPDQSQVAGAIASDLLPFSMTSWGSGGGGGIAGTYAHSLGRVALGVGGSYLTHRAFEPLEGGQFVAYRPGDQLGMQAAANVDVGNAGKAALQVVLLHQADDRLSDANLFRSGNRYQAMGSYAFRAGRSSSGIVYLGGGHRECGGALMEVVRDSPSQDLALVGTGFRLPVRPGLVLVPTLESRVFRTGDGVGQGYLTGAGAGLEFSTGDTRIVPRARAQLGRVLVREGAESNVVGFDLGLSITFGNRR